MNTQDRRKRHARAFSLVELLVVLGVIAALSAISAGVIIRARQVSRGMTCANNLRQIATGLLTYYTEYELHAVVRPGDAADAAGRRDLRAAGVRLSVLAVSDHRQLLAVLCAARADDGDRLSPRLPEPYRGEFDVRRLRRGIDPQGQDRAGALEQSARRARKPGHRRHADLRRRDHRLHQLRRERDRAGLVRRRTGPDLQRGEIPTGSLGTIEVQAAHGTHFDVATPACTAGVRGTQFTVTTSNPSGEYQTDIAVTEGTVWVDGGLARAEHDGAPGGQLAHFPS